jgi:putative phosphoribosyl transferase
MFRDRKEGGEKLARALHKYQKENPLILGIPRGGVETAYYVACGLQTELSLIITRKLGYPFNPEAAFGALAEDGSVFLFEEAQHTLPPEIITSIVNRERKEIVRRIQKLRRGHPLPDMKGRTVILVDDGIATGATLLSSIALCRNKGAEKIVVASPVSGQTILQELHAKADEVVILTIPKNFYAVSQGYYHFHDLEDEAVISLLEQWENEHLVPVGKRS